MKTNVTATPSKIAYDSPVAEIILIMASAFFMLSNQSPQNEKTYEEELF